MKNITFIVSVDGRPYGQVRRPSTAKALYFEALELFRDGHKVECHRLTDEVVDLSEFEDSESDGAESTD